MDTPRKTAIPEDAAPLSFPFWPLACVAYAEHIGRDYREHLKRLGQAATGVEMVESEGLYDAHLLRDLTKAVYDLALAPYAALWATGDAPPVPSEGLGGPETGEAPETFPHGQPGID